MFYNNNLENAMQKTPVTSRYEEKVATVLAARQKDGFDGLILQFDNGALGYLPRQELDEKVIKQSLVPFVGKRMLVQLRYRNMNGTWQCSRRQLQLRRKQQLLEKLSDKRVVDATVIKLQEFGAYVQIDGISARLPNSCFAMDYTRVMDVYKEGDKIPVRLQRVTAGGTILVEAETLYCGTANLAFEHFERDQVFYGRIRTLKDWGCFVGIAPGLDVLTPVPELAPNIRLLEGMGVSVRITKVDPEQKRLRGRVVDIVDDARLLEVV